MTIYKRSGDTFTKLATPVITSDFIAFSVEFSSDGIYLAVAHTGGDCITIFKRSGDTFTKLAAPDYVREVAAYAVAFSNDVAYLTMGYSGGVIIYQRSGDTFTYVAQPTNATQPPGTVRGLSFSADDTYLAVAHSLSPFISIYKRSGGTFTKLANPDILPAGAARTTAFSDDGTYLAVAHEISPFITIYKRSGDTFTKLANLAILPPGIGTGTSFTPNAIYLAVSNGPFSTEPFINIYKRSDDTFTKLNDPATLPPKQAQGIAFSPDGTYLAVPHSNTPFITIYKTILGEFEPAYAQIVKVSNTLPAANTVNAGYALEDGIAGETKTMMSLFGTPIAVPTSVSLTTAPTGFQSSPPSVYLRVGFTNPTNQTVDVEALLFRADTPGTLLGVNNLPTTLAPNATFGPSNVDIAPENGGLHILTVRIKEPGKSFSDIVEVSVNLVS